MCSHWFNFSSPNQWKFCLQIYILQVLLVANFMLFAKIAKLNIPTKVVTLRYFWLYDLSVSLWQIYCDIYIWYRLGEVLPSTEFCFSTFKPDQLNWFYAPNPYIYFTPNNSKSRFLIITKDVNIYILYKKVLWICK